MKLCLGQDSVRGIGYNKNWFWLIVQCPFAFQAACLLPLLEIVHALIKKFRKKNVFVCDYIFAIKVYQSQLYTMYNNPNISFISNSFEEFTSLVARTHVISWQWISLMKNMGEPLMEYIIPRFDKHTFYATYTSLDWGLVCPINQTIFKQDAKFACTNIYCSPFYFSIFLVWICYHDFMIYAITLSICLMLWFHFW
jgi:hypothetical protein